MAAGTSTLRDMDSSVSPPPPVSPRFTLELEFVLCLSNAYYLQYLAQTYPHLLNPPTPADKTAPDDSEAARFARYLAYLYAYWKQPEYAKYLTHPGAVLRNLELLQQEQFRKDIIRPDVIGKLLEVDAKAQADANGTQTQHVEATGNLGQNKAGEAMDSRPG